jgi:hypothetical protein
MNAVSNGGLAFPVHGGYEGDDPRNLILGGGMTLRDYFAAKAPITVDDAMLACGVIAHSIGMIPRTQRIVVLAALAEMRADYADAMIAERAK